MLLFIINNIILLKLSISRFIYSSQKNDTHEHYDRIIGLQLSLNPSLIKSSYMF